MMDTAQRIMIWTKVVAQIGHKSDAIVIHVEVVLFNYTFQRKEEKDKSLLQVKFTLSQLEGSPILIVIHNQMIHGICYRVLFNKLQITNVQVRVYEENF